MDAIWTKDPYEELLKESASLGVGVKALDYTLLSYTTNYSLDDREFKELGEKDLFIFDDDNVFLDDKLNIWQNYKIKIKQINPHEAHISQKVTLLNNKDYTKLLVDLDLNGLSFHSNIAMEILQEIYKKMIKNKLLLGLRMGKFKEDLLHTLKAFRAKTLHNNKARLLLAKGIPSISAHVESLTLSYKDKIHENKNVLQKVSIIGVNEGDLILKHTQPGQGKRGRNLRLEFIEPHIPPQQDIKFSVSENLEGRDICEIGAKSHITEYYARKKGFISLKEGHFDIENDLELSSVTFKEFGAVLGGTDNNITINVKSNSQLEDAVGSGVHIECETLTVNGIVGGNTVLRAKTVKVYGITSPTAKIYAQNAYISTHRGFVEAEYVDIDSVENGVVKAKHIAKLKKSLGANITASLIWINSLAANNNITFNQITVIETCSGANNKFTVIPVLDETKDPMNDLEELELRERKLPELIEKLEETINSSQSAVEKIKKKIDQLKKQNMPIPNNFNQMLRQFVNYNHKLSALHKEESQLKLKKEKLIKYLQELDHELFDSRLINKGSKWSDMCSVNFMFSHSKLSYATKKDEEIKLFYARRDQNNQVRIEQNTKFEDKDVEWLKESKAQ